MSHTQSDQELVRREALTKLRALGIEPFLAAHFPVSHTAAKLKEEFKEVGHSPQGQQPVADVVLAGRLMSAFPRMYICGPIMVAVISISSCAMRNPVVGQENSIQGEWIIPGNGQGMMASTVMVSDTIDWASINSQFSNEVLNWGSDVEQTIRLKPLGKGELRDATRGRIRFNYQCKCDSTRAISQLVDSADFYVERLVALQPCTLTIGSAKYEFEKEPDRAIPDSLQVCKRLTQGPVIVARHYLTMIRRKD